MYNLPLQMYSFERRHCSVFSDVSVKFTTAEVFNVAAIFTLSRLRAALFFWERGIIEHLL